MYQVVPSICTVHELHPPQSLLYLVALRGQRAAHSFNVNESPFRERIIFSGTKETEEPFEDPDSYWRLLEANEADGEIEFQ